jgi:TRAP-type C4-dicarboxylate transport system substrate-binding protein
VRHLILRKEVKTIDDFPKVQMRVQGSPLHQKVFSATGLKATPMDYMEVYNAIKTGVLDGLENEPAGLKSMKFYEVAPYYVSPTTRSRPGSWPSARRSSSPSWTAGVPC